MHFPASSVVRERISLRMEREKESSCSSSRPSPESMAAAMEAMPDFSDSRFVDVREAWGRRLKAFWGSSREVVRPEELGEAAGSMRSSCRSFSWRIRLRRYICDTMK